MAAGTHSELKQRAGRNVIEVHTDAAGVAVEDISLRPPTLDEVFLALTGQGLEPAADTAAGHAAA